MFGKYFDQLGAALSLFELSCFMLAISIAITCLLWWCRLGTLDNSYEDWGRYFKERPWWQSSIAFVAHVVLAGLRGGAQGIAAASFVLVIAYLIYPEIGAIKG